MEINVFQDLACPWCRIGKHNLEQAIKLWHDEPITIQYRAFLLDPDTPAEGVLLRPYLQEKIGAQASVADIIKAPVAAGAKLGLAFNFDQIEIVPSTILGQRLLKIVPHSQQTVVLDALHTAYFEHGLNIGDLAVILDIVGELGIDQAWVREQLRNDAGLAAVYEDVMLAQELQIRGVPFFILGDRYGISGAQPPQVLLQVMQETLSALA